jgi:hypothetical protein
MRDGLANHWRECYVQERIKSMKVEEMATLKRMVSVTSQFHSLTCRRLGFIGIGPRRYEVAE